MRIPASCKAILAWAAISHPLPAAAQVDQQRAQEYFKEAQALCERDGGRLWGVSICGPMVIADRRTQTIATSQPPPDGARPPLLGLLNAPIQWGGERWTAYIWDYVVTAPPRRRKELFLHELFHGVQAHLGVGAAALDSEHLDGADGRYWLRLEWRALARALRESGEPRKLAVRDALAFRQSRRTLYPGSVESERGQEITEGLAAYTATVLAADSTADALASAVDLLTEAETGAVEASFVRTFAYMSGPAYGVLLDASSPGWTRSVRGVDDLGTLLMRALAVEPAADATASAGRYGGVEVRAAEQQREQQRQDRLADLRRRFVDGPVLLLPGGGGAQFNSMGAVAIPDVGTVYFGAYNTSGDWGTLAAEKGVLIASDGRSRRVAAPVRREDGTFAGDGWTFKAGPGWVVREGARPGDYEVVRQQPAVAADVVYGHKNDGLALTFDVHRPARPNGAGVISVVSGGWQSSVEMSRLFARGYAPLLEKGFTVFAVRHGTSPKYPMSAIVVDVRRAVRALRQNAGQYGVDRNRIGVYGASAGGQLAQYSPIRFVSPGSAPSLIVHGDADTVVPIAEGETMYAAATKAGAPASFMRIDGAGHDFSGADLERVTTAMVQWFERHLGSAAQ